MAEARKRGGHKRPAHLAGGSVEQKMWDAVRALQAKGKPFTRADVEFASKQAETAVRCYVCRLAAGGFIKAQGKQPRDGALCPHYSWQRYALVRDVGHRAPRLDKAGRLLRETNRERMWTALRVLKQFTPLDLQLSVNAAGGRTLPYLTAKTYLQGLAQAGYLVVVSAGRTGPGSRASTYRLVNAMDTGPRSPIEQACGAFFDPNIREVTWQPK